MNPTEELTIEQRLDNLEASMIQLHHKVDNIVSAVESALGGLQNNPMIRAMIGGK